MPKVTDNFYKITLEDDFFPNTMFSRDIWYGTSKTLRNGYNVRGPFFLLHYYQWRFCIIESIMFKNMHRKYLFDPFN